MQGFDLVETNTVPFGMQYFEELTLYKKKGETFKDLLFNRFNNNVFENRRDALTEILKSYSISTIILDSFIGADFLAYYDILQSASIRLFYITTMSPLIYGKEVPNFRNKRWKSANRKLFFTPILLKEHFFLLGQTSMYLIKKNMKVYGISNHDIIVFNRSSIIFKHFEELILSWYSHINLPIRDNMRAIGLSVDTKRHEMIAVNDLERFNFLVTTNQPIIYISFGTLYRNCQIAKLIKKLVLAATRFENYHFIFGNIRGEIQDIINMKTSFIPKNVSFFGVLPQLQVLSKASLFITHGGFNSIKEAIYFGIPLMVFPLNKTHDQFLNAKYVMDKGIGIICKSLKISIETLFERMSLLLEPSTNQSFLRNINNERQIIRQDIIEHNIDPILNLITYDKELL